MAVVDQPFLTRRDILGVLRPGQLTTESPFRTLKAKRAASSGFTVPLRGDRGQVMGKLQLYSNLNADAARAFRLARREEAAEFAQHAHRLESSEPAQYLRDLVEIAAAVFARREERPPSLERYLTRRGSSGEALDTEYAMTEWLARADAWLPPTGDADRAYQALAQLAADAQEVRSTIDGAHASSVTSFYGVVRRMDLTAAELEGEEQEAILIPRDDLEREGLASLGQAVTLLWEALPGGGTYLLPRAAITLDPPSSHALPSPFDPDGSSTTTTIDPADAAWLQRSLTRDPKAIPLAALRVSES